MLIKGMNPVSMMANYVRYIEQTDEYQRINPHSSRNIELPSSRLSGLSTYATTYAPNDLVFDKPVFTLHGISEQELYGLDLIALDVYGCMNRCGYCYVPRSDLGDVKFDNQQYAGDRAERIPDRFNGRSIFTAPEMFEYLDAEISRNTSSKSDEVGIGSGEALSNAWAISELGHLIRDSGRKFTVEVDTTGFPLISNPDLIDLFEGLGAKDNNRNRGIINFEFSIFKGRNLEEHERIAETQGTFWDSGPKVVAWLLSNGFWVYPSGIMTGLFAHPNPKDLERVPDSHYVKENKHGEKFFTDDYYRKLAYETANWLHDQLSTIHPLYPRLLGTYDVTTGARIKIHKQQSERLRKAGFIIESEHVMVSERGNRVPKKLVQTRPAVFKRALEEVFAQKNTPLIKLRDGEAEMHNEEYVDVMHTVINDLAKKRDLMRQALVKYRRAAQARYKTMIELTRARKTD